MLERMQRMTEVGKQRVIHLWMLGWSLAGGETRIIHAGKLSKAALKSLLAEAGYGKLRSTAAKYSFATGPKVK